MIVELAKWGVRSARQ